MRSDTKFIGIIMLVLALILAGVVIAIILGIDIEACEDYDIVRVGKTTTQVCDND